MIENIHTAEITCVEPKFLLRRGAMSRCAGPLLTLTESIPSGLCCNLLSEAGSEYSLIVGRHTRVGISASSRLI